MILSKGSHEIRIEAIKAIPREFKLAQNFPNPFNSVTDIQYSVPDVNHITLSIYNVLGQEIKSLVDEKQEAGIYTVSWDGCNNDGKEAASGVYIFRLQAGNSFTAAKKMILLQ